MLRFLKIFCISVVCAIMLFGCSPKQEKVKYVESEQLEQSEIDDNTEKNEVENIREENLDLSNAFNGINGCAILYIPSENRYSYFNKDMAEQEASPYSTFKIISTLSGLQNDIIIDESSTMGYDGTDYGNSEWNEDLTLEQAFQKSCIWYFREVINSVGKDKIQEELNKLKYGNCDVSEWTGSNINPLEKLNGFWLDSSLKISPLEQIEVLERIFEGQSDYDSRDIEILKRIMLIEENDTQKIYGKTGTGGSGEAWFVGFLESKGERKYFAVYLNDSSQREHISGSVAKEIVLKIIE